jgi:hypothetical protein
MLPASPGMVIFWIQKNAGMRGVAYNVGVPQHHTLVELYIDDQRSRENNLRIFREGRA